MKGCVRGLGLRDCSLFTFSEPAPPKSPPPSGQVAGHSDPMDPTTTPNDSSDLMDFTGNISPAFRRQAFPRIPGTAVIIDAEARFRGPELGP